MNKAYNFIILLIIIFLLCYLMRHMVKNTGVLENI